MNKRAKLEKYKQDLVKLFRRSRWLMADSEEEKTRMRSTMECPVKTLTLYRYMPVNEYTLLDLQLGRLTLTDPNLFNDPYDSLLYIDSESACSSIRNFTLEDFKGQIALVRKGSPFPSKCDAGQLKLYEALARLPDESLEREIYPRYKEIQRLGLQSLLDYPEKMRGRVRVGCLSERCDSAPMWAHYADLGRGICVQYEVAVQIGVPIKGQDFGRDLTLSVLPVLYSRQRYNATHLVQEAVQEDMAAHAGVLQELDISHFDCLSSYKLTAFKSNDWAYEKEWRVFVSAFTPNDPSRVSIPVYNVTGVILGHAISIEKTALVMRMVEDLIRARQIPIALRRIKVDSCSKQYCLSALDLSTEDKKS